MEQIFRSLDQPTSALLVRVTEIVTDSTIIIIMHLQHWNKFIWLTQKNLYIMHSVEKPGNGIQFCKITVILLVFTMDGIIMHS